MANAITTQPKQQTGIATYLGGDAVKKNIAGVIGQKNLTRFVSSVVSAVQVNPQLAKCTNASILSGALEAEANGLSLSPQLAQAHLVPYKNRKKVGNQWVEVDEATLQIGWRGYIQLAIRSGQYKTIVVSEVKDGELAKFNPITEEIELSPIEDPAVREATPTIGYYAMFRLNNNFEKVLFMSREAMEAYARHYSRSYRYDIDNNKKQSPWSTVFDAMAKKTMIKQLIGKWGIMSIEMQQAYINDQAVIDEDGTARYVDNPNAVDVETQVAEDIATNANSVEFIEEEQPIKEEKPKAKRGSKPKAEPIPAPEPVEVTSMPKPETPEVETVIDIEAVDDGPEWG